MTMRGSYYLVKESGDAMPGEYGSTVKAWRETNRLVEGEVEGEGVWVKVGVVRAVQVADWHNLRTASGANEAEWNAKFNNSHEASEAMAQMTYEDAVADGNKDAPAAVGEEELSLVPVAGMLVRTFHNGNLETERIVQVGDWVIRQESSVQKEVMVLEDENFRARYMEMPEMNES